ncbi:MAG: hypothetical protein GXP61_04255 [Epsilonproteobacteria bacterium]|nr:hypothetical protein [Campylobacterota bacterium]
MTQQEMSKLLNISDRTLRSWKNRRTELYGLLERLDYTQAQTLVFQKSNEHIIRLLENQKYFTDYRSFERELFELLVSGIDTKILKKLSKDTILSKEARARSAYLYTFLTKKPTKLSFTLKNKTGLYHERKLDSGDSLSGYYGLISGVDPHRFNQYKMKGLN